MIEGQRSRGRQGRMWGDDVIGAIVKIMGSGKKSGEPGSWEIHGIQSSFEDGT